MSGGLMQLVAYGAQDVYLTGNPQITFFKVVYRRHTNFSMECSQVPTNGNPDFGRTINVTIPRNGDLITQIYLRVILNRVHDEEFTGKFAWTRRLGFAMIKNIEIQIGGSQIDKHYGTWMDIWYELTHDDNHVKGMNKMIGDVPELTALNGKNTTGLIKPAYTLFVPLSFWFCRNPGLALPLIALQYHEVKIAIEFNKKDELACWTGDFTSTDAYDELKINDANLLVNYVYLDTEERRKFAQVGHEYLIEQLQFTGAENIPNGNVGDRVNYNSRLNFNHPTKELVWVAKSGNYTSGKHFLAYTHSDNWEAALDEAAQNIANGMFRIGKLVGTSISVPTEIRDQSVPIEDQDHSIPTSKIWGNTSHRLNYTIDVIDTRADVSSNVSPDFHASGLYMIQDVFYINKYNLGDKIDDVCITLRLSDGPHGVPVYEIERIVAQTHTLTVRDISIPIEYWNDFRGNKGKDDVVVHQHFNYGLLIDGSENPVQSALIQLNGHDRFDRREGDYFNYVQPYEHHKHTPKDGVNVYSFAINPENHQPSGSANLSRIDSTILHLTFFDKTKDSAEADAPSLAAFSSDTQLFVFAFNYNVLRIMSGMGGLAYSN